ncbi:hypothetical protein BD324DRAFT_653117 [Kockovaella imperatae]|uniref:Uncharacterized protein n=1 Tax=Kockovaella imperatae TaxID=4999 RepID=A0A1Y1UBF9_9TREE|nr:hypothetical protein BD324DRAFT_653117 [Kockovaella imperatae]ORX34864.1 hypothetical protein BD324DRAFT_653117 [Kockovaella imperatae]
MLPMEYSVELRSAVSELLHPDPESWPSTAELFTRTHFASWIADAQRGEAKLQMEQRSLEQMRLKLERLMRSQTAKERALEAKEMSLEAEKRCLMLRASRSPPMATQTPQTASQTPAIKPEERAGAKATKAMRPRP